MGLLSEMQHRKIPGKGVRNDHVDKTHAYKGYALPCQLWPQLTQQSTCTCTCVSSYGTHRRQLAHKNSSLLGRTTHLPHTNPRQHAQEAMTRPSKGSSAAVAASLKKVRKGKGSLWSSLLFKYPGAVVMGFLSLAFCVVISLWRPLTPEQFARQWYVCSK